MAASLAGRATSEYQRAVKAGILVRPSSCEECGKACKPDGHHDDYSKPLDVRWLCQTCHRILVRTGNHPDGTRDNVTALWKMVRQQGVEVVAALVDRKPDTVQRWLRERHIPAAMWERIDNGK